MAANHNHILRLSKESIFSCFNIPKNQFRKLVSLCLKSLLHFVNKINSIPAHVIINFHIRNNNQCFRHIFRRNVHGNCRFKNSFKSFLKIGVITNISSHYLVYLLSKSGFFLNLNVMGLVSESHIQIMIITLITFSKINCQTNRSIHGAAAHRTANISHD